VGSMLLDRRVSGSRDPRVFSFTQMKEVVLIVRVRSRFQTLGQIGRLGIEYQDSLPVIRPSR
ncbi:MAG: hypothetical protein WD468_12135, partial [Pirellulales bacterium]